MKKNMIKALLISLCFLLVFVPIIGCSKSTSEGPSNNEGKTEEKADKKENAKVGLILSGPISDMSWNATAHKGLMKIKDLGAEVSYQENVANSACAASIQTYADAGYNLIFLSSNIYEETAIQIAQDYPDTTFIIINGDTTKDNICSFKVADEQQGFMQGVVASLATKSKQVGFIGGLNITPIINGQKGFEAGVKYVDESIVINSTLLGSTKDVNNAKETAKAMINKGVDVIAPMADNASLGVMEAAEEKGVHAVAPGIDMDKVAPKATLIGIVKDTSVAYEAAYKVWNNGELPNETTKMGADVGIITLTDWYPAADNLSQDIKSKVMDIYEELKAGKITINLN